MATKTTEAPDAPTAVTETPAAVPAETRSRRGLRLGAIIAGAVVAAALLFGGGVLLGVNLPDGGGRPGFSQGDFPGGGQPPQGGPQQQQQQPQQNDGN